MNLFSKKKKFERKVSLKQETRDGILSYCKMSHPDEGILILRGKSKHGNVLIDGLVIPPFSETGADFAGFPHNPLPRPDPEPPEPPILAIYFFRKINGKIMNIASAAPRP